MTAPPSPCHVRPPVTSERKYVNVSRRTPIVEGLAERTGLPLLHFNLTKGEVKAIAGCSLETLQGKGEGLGKGTSASKKGGGGSLIAP